MPGSVHPEDESMVDVQPLDDSEQQQEEGLEVEDEQEVFENDRQRITIVRPTSASTIIKPLCNPAADTIYS